MTRVHATAIVHPEAVLGDDVEIGPYCIVADNVTIGNGTRVHEHVKIDRFTRIGDHCEIFFGAVLGHVSVDLKYRGGECWTIIGNRNVIREYVSVSASSFEGKATVIGNNNLLMHWVNIAHDCVIGDRIIMANFATLGGHVEMEGNARIGAHASFHQFVRVGRGAMAGACSKFVKDLPPYMVADGHPAQIRGLNLLGRETAVSHPMRDVPEESVRLLKHAYRILCRSKLNTHQAIERIRSEIPADPHVEHLVRFIETSQRGICK
jgi:UDP-N-acetylglucosamine acyltransferase